MAITLNNPSRRRVTFLLASFCLAVFCTCRAQNSTPVHGDTTRPPLPAQPNLPVDSTFTVEAPDLPREAALYYRNIVGIVFDDTTGGTSIRRLLTRYAGTIVGGNPADTEYIVSIPDPVPRSQPSNES